MSGVTFKAVAKRAFAEAAEAVRWNKPVSVMLALAISASSVGITYSATGDPSIGGLAGIIVPAAFLAALFVWKLITVPLAIAREASAERDEAKAALAVAEAEARDPDGIYQHGARVGVVTLPVVSAASGQAQFAQIHDALEFNTDQPFEYRNWILQFSGCQTHFSGHTGGTAFRKFNVVTANIVGRL